MMKWPIGAALLIACSTPPISLGGQARTLSAADSALVGRILLAEDRRDSTDAALAEGARHADERVRLLARRARGRIADPHFTARHSPTAPGPCGFAPRTSSPDRAGRTTRSSPRSAGGWTRSRPTPRGARRG